MTTFVKNVSKAISLSTLLAGAYSIGTIFGVGLAITVFESKRIVEETGSVDNNKLGEAVGKKIDELFDFVPKYQWGNIEGTMFMSTLQTFLDKPVGCIATSLGITYKSLHEMTKHNNNAKKVEVK